MKVRDLMTPSVETIRPEDTFEAAARKMRDHDIGGLPVLDGGELVGFVTDRDIVVRGIAQGLEASEGRIRDVMTPDSICAYEDEDEVEASDRMRDHQVRRLLVCDRDGRPIGMLSLGDLAVRGSEEPDEALEGISRPARPKSRGRR